MGRVELDGRVVAGHLVSAAHEHRRAGEKESLSRLRLEHKVDALWLLGLALAYRLGIDASLPEDHDVHEGP